MNIKSEQEMLEFGRNYAKQLTNSHITDNDNRKPSSQQKPPSNATLIELIGDVGTGKTTFTRGLAQGLGITEPITSPSFTISKSYALPQGGNLVHYDFYRLSDPGLMADDLQDNLNNPHNIIIIEWGKSIAQFLPQSHIIIKIEYTKTGDRKVTI